jgi:hyperosmotically inducible protein
MKIGQTISTFAAALVIASLGAIPSWGATGGQPSVNTTELEHQVRQVIAKLPYYGVFDELAYSVDANGQVTLSGQVRTYNVHNSAVRAVREIPGVLRVADEIEVLPLSPNDDSIRVRAYNAIFGFPALSRYAVRAQSPIRILVKNGNVTLSGFVSTAMDRDLIYSRVRLLPGAFKITNELQLDNAAPPQPIG